jgi:hypothetical protein
MVFDLVIETHILSVIPKLIQINVIPCNIFITVPGRFAPNPVRPDTSNSPSYAIFLDIYNNNKYQMSNNESEQRNFTHLIRCQTKSKAIHFFLYTTNK